MGGWVGGFKMGEGVSHTVSIGMGGRYFEMILKRKQVISDYIIDEACLICASSVPHDRLEACKSCMKGF